VLNLNPRQVLKEFTDGVTVVVLFQGMTCDDDYDNGSDDDADHSGSSDDGHYNDDADNWGMMIIGG